MRNWKRWLIFIGVTLLVLAVAGLGVGVLLTHFLVDLWWFRSMEYEGYFWLRFLYRYIFSGGVTLFFFLIFFLNFWSASRYLGVDESEFARLARSPEGTRSQRLLYLFQTGAMSVYTPLSLLMSVVIALPFYREWEAALLFFFGSSSGVSDPLYGQDISFYLFLYPLLSTIQQALLWQFIILSALMALLYWIEHAVLPSRRKSWQPEARLHLTALVVVALLIQAWGFMLQRYSLLYVDHNEPVFFGPGFVEMRYHLPLIWLSAITFLGAALALIFYVRKGKGLKAAFAFAAVFLAAQGLQQVKALPEFISKYIVTPNFVRTQRSFIQANIDATSDAYALKDVQYVDFDLSNDLKEDIERISPELERFLTNIPVWDNNLLNDVFQQLQGIRPYYHFSDVDVGRYSIEGRLRQVDQSVREVNIDRLPENARTWENIHLRYTHGYGVVMTPTSQRAAEPMQWYLKDLEQQSPVGLKVERPDIYYGEENLDWAIVPNKLHAVDIPVSASAMASGLRDAGGVGIDSFFRRLLFSLYFKDYRIFFSASYDDTGKVLLRRNIVERINELAPFVALDGDPYVAVTPDRIYWVQDAYTLSQWYPASKFSSVEFRTGRTDKERRDFNYIRNSVKVVVDAYSGSTRFYVTDPNDPIIRAYDSAYPGLFREVREMLPLIREQLRYPRDLFAAQMQMFSRYHQTNPDLFYQQSETWTFAKDIHGEPVHPYYLTIDTRDCPAVQKFVLIAPMTPVGRDNLSVLAMGGPTEKDNCVLDYAGKISVYKFPQRHIDGPAQIGALIDQNPLIRQQFTLWDQLGSRVKRGRMVILQVGRAVVYVQPVYIVSTTQAGIPELVRVIVSMGREVVMDTTVRGALEKLLEHFKEERVRDAQEAGKPPAAAPAAPPAPVVPGAEVKTY